MGALGTGPRHGSPAGIAFRYISTSVSGSVTGTHGTVCSAQHDFQIAFSHHDLELDLAVSLVSPKERDQEIAAGQVLNPANAVDEIDRRAAALDQWWGFVWKAAHDCTARSRGRPFVRSLPVALLPA